jgi:Co/Zn/Cd efflux system component
MPPQEVQTATTIYGSDLSKEIPTSSGGAQSQPAKGSSNTGKPTNEYVLNVAFYSFIGFVFVQAVFALIANSQSMLADSEAMSVDALTYLFNLAAERIKNRPYTEQEELELPESVRLYRRELRRLYLELIPPAVSVATLIVVTVTTLREALSTLRPTKDDEVDEDDGVSVPIMLFFSGANLLLDVVNVTCFARAESTFGFEVVRKENDGIRKNLTLSSTAVNESTRLLIDDEREEANVERRISSSEESASSSSCLKDSSAVNMVNLNMCSAWTHVCADTLRSAAVLVAAVIATCIPSIEGDKADSYAAVAVSIIILGSLLPLLQGLVYTVVQIVSLHRRPPPSVVERSISLEV